MVVSQNYMCAMREPQINFSERSLISGDVGAEALRFPRAHQSPRDPMEPSLFHAQLDDPVL